MIGAEVVASTVGDMSGVASGRDMNGGDAPSGRMISSAGGETLGELIGGAERLDEVVFADEVLGYGLL
jgi:hypothetical protein